MTARSPHSFSLLCHFWQPTCCHSRALSLRLPHLLQPTCHLDRGPTIRSPSCLSFITKLRPYVIILSSGPHFIHVDGAPSFPDGFLQYVEENSVYVGRGCHQREARIWEDRDLGGGLRASWARGCLWDSNDVDDHGDEVVKLLEGFTMVVRSL